MTQRLPNGNNMAVTFLEETSGGGMIYPIDTGVEIMGI